MPGTADSGAMAGEKIMGKSSGEGVHSKVVDASFVRLLGEITPE